MTKKLWTAVAALLLCLTLSVPALAADAPRLSDGADLLTDAEEQTLLARLDEVTNLHQVELVIVTVDGMDGLTAERYANRYYDQHSFGLGQGRDGVLLLVSMEYRDWYILTNGFGTTAVDELDVDLIGDTVADSLSNAEYAAAFTAFIDGCAYEINGEINGFPFEFGTNLLIALVVGFVVALIVTGVMRSQLKSVRPQQAANQYTRPGSMQLTMSNDLFLYRIVDRRKKETSSSSGGSRSGGSSRGGGGGKF